MHPHSEKVVIQPCFPFPEFVADLLSKGPIYFQKLVREMVIKHRGEEEKAGKEIWPATPEHVPTDKLQEEMSFCDKLECDAIKGDNGILSW